MHHFLVQVGYGSLRIYDQLSCRIWIPIRIPNEDAVPDLGRFGTVSYDYYTILSYYTKWYWAEVGSEISAYRPYQVTTPFLCFSALKLYVTFILGAYFALQ
jgi:hypothetical protein